MAVQPASAVEEGVCIAGATLGKGKIDPPCNKAGSYGD